MKDVTLTFSGVNAMLMQANTLVDPLNPQTKAIKAITSKRKRTEQDELEVRRLEWHAALYHDDTLGPYVPAPNIERCLKDAATATRNGKDVQRAVIVKQDKVPLDYHGPRDREGLWACGEFIDVSPVKLQASTSMMRARPKFPEWALTFDVALLDDLLDFETFAAIVERAGVTTGLGSWRPRQGRFDVSIH